MSRLIDADEQKTIRNIQRADFNSIETIQKWIDEMPTIEAEPVKRGKWEYVDAPVFGNPYGSYKCDYCGNSMPHKTNYCPNCGAKMENGN